MIFYNKYINIFCIFLENVFIDGDIFVVGFKIKPPSPPNPIMS